MIPSDASPVRNHDLPCVIGPDRYCETHGIVDCKVTAKPRPDSNTGQLTRIEARLNRIMRHLGIEVDE